MVLLAKCVDNALFREKIIDKETFKIVYKEMDELTEQQWREQYLNNIP